MKFKYDGGFGNEILTIEDLEEIWEDECYYQSSIGRREPRFFELLANLEESGLLTITEYWFDIIVKHNIR